MISLSDGIKLLGLVNRGVNADLYKSIGEHVDQVNLLLEERAGLKDENRELKRALEFHGTMKRVGSWGYVDGDDYPICSRCAEVDNRPVHLNQARKPGGDFSVCPQCNAERRRYLRRSQVEEMIQQGGSV